MNFVLALSGAIPALFFMWLVERLDAKRPEPRWQLRKVAILGGLSTLPVILVQVPLDALAPEGLAGALFTSFIVAAITEESAKAVVVWVGVWRNPAFDERMDGIVYATRAGLGFALVENVGYLLSSKSFGGFIGIFILRAVLAVPGHAIYAGFMGYWAARRRFDRKGPGLWGGLLIAILLHGSYDAALFSIGVLGKDGGLGVLLVLPLLLVPLGVVGGGYWRLKKHARDALLLDDAAELAALTAARPRLPVGVGFVLR